MRAGRLCLYAQGNWTPLHEAALHGHEGGVRVLVEAGADINAKSSGGVRECMLAMPMRKTAAHVGTRMHALPHGQAGCAHAPASWMWYG